MGFKDNAMWFVGGAVIALGLPTILGWANIMWRPPYSVAFDWPSGMMPAMSGEGEEIYSYAGRAGGRTGTSRSVTITPRAGGRAVSGHTGNTIGYGGDLRAAPPGWQAQLLNPALSGTVARHVRS